MASTSKPARSILASRNGANGARVSSRELPSLTSRSNRSLRTEVSVAGKRNFQGRDKEVETALEIQGRGCRDKISLGNSANSGLIAGFREVSVRTRMRGGASRTRTCRRLMMSRLTARSPKSSCYARPDHTLGQNRSAAHWDRIEVLPISVSMLATRWRFQTNSLNCLKFISDKNPYISS
jgi:hypothetical protein